jgi:hypothetical protein
MIHKCNNGQPRHSFQKSRLFPRKLDYRREPSLNRRQPLRGALICVAAASAGVKVCARDGLFAMLQDDATIRH